MTDKQRTLIQRSLRTMVIMLLIASFVIQGNSKPVSAGKEAVYLNGEVYITIEEARISSGMDNQTFQFTLSIHNGSSASLNFNNYGVAIVDRADNRFTAELTDKVNARIKPNSDTAVKYISRLPSDIALSDLKVQIFAWDFKSSTYVNVIGELSVSETEHISLAEKAETIINLKDIDSSYNSDALVGIQIEDSFKILNDGQWYLYVHALLENIGGSSIKLPSNVLVSLKDHDGLVYGGSIIAGSEQSILPKQAQTIVLQFPIGNLDIDKGLSMEISKKSTSAVSSGAQTSGNQASASSGGSATGATTTTNTSLTNSANSLNVLGSLDLGSVSQASDLKEERMYPGYSGQIRTVMDSVSISDKSDGVHVKTDWILKNTGKQALALPVLSGSYQLNGSSLNVTAIDSLSHPTYLAVGESTTFRFEAVLPAGVDTSIVQLVVEEKKGNQQSPVSLGTLPASNQNDDIATDGTNISYTSAGRLALNVKSSYRLMTDSGEDVLMTELQVQNMESKVITLPNLYAGYTDGDLEVEGKAVRVQTSAFLNPGEKTTLYLYAKLPYSLTMAGGFVYIGEGTLDSKTNMVTKTKQWAKLPYITTDTKLDEMLYNQEWFTSDSGRKSMAKFIDTQVYDTEDNGTLVAVRVAQKNLEGRTNSAVPYTGYFVGSNGSVWPANVTQDTGKVSRDGWSMVTLWIKEPVSYELLQSLVLGPQIDNEVFASPRSYKLILSKSPTSKVWFDEDFKATLRPYSITLSGMTHSVNNSKYEFSFQYTVTKDMMITQESNKNRSYYIELKTSTGRTVKTWNVPLEGEGSFTPNSVNKLTVEGLSANDLTNVPASAQFVFYEKFEGGTRLLGTIIAKD